MKQQVKIYLIAMLLSSVVIGCLQNVGTITGRVIDSGNNAVIGAVVFVEPDGSAGITNLYGKYTIESLPLGNYTVIATSGGISNSVEVIVADEGFGCTPPKIEADNIQLGM
jgi:hypothetical protein